MSAEGHDHQTELTVIRCQLGERTAFDDLVERWHPRLYRYTRCMVQRDEQAEEAVQEVWVRVLRGLPLLREPARFEPWCFGIARRILADRLRDKYARAARNTEPQSATPQSNDPPAPFDAEDTARLRAALTTLPLIEREAVALFHLEGLSLTHTASITGVPEGTVKSRLHRARQMLRAAMQQQGTPQ